jgi:hypothetical protein
MVFSLATSDQLELPQRLADRLRGPAGRMQVRELFPTVIPEARDIVATEPYALCLAEKVINYHWNEVSEVHEVGG